MSEVIDLISSSPPQRQESTVYKIRATTSGKNSSFNFNFDTDDFDLIGNLDFAVDQPSKRRRLTSPAALPKRDVDLVSAPQPEEIFNLSSEANLLPDLREAGSQVLELSEQQDEFDIDDDNVFRFSSSAPELLCRAEPKEPFVLELSSDAEDIPPADHVSNPSTQEKSAKLVLSERTANLVANLRTTNSKGPQKSKVAKRSGRSASVDPTVTKITRFKQITKPSAVPRDEIVDSSHPEASMPKSKVVSKESSVNHEGRVTTKALSKEEREAEKERKRQGKEQKSLEKQKAADIAEVNKSKTNKKNSTPEMIVDMPSSLKGLSVGNQVEEYMKQLDVQVTFSREEEEVNLTNDTEISFGKIVRWRRKVVAEYDEALEIRVPLAQPRITRENHVLVYFKAEDFINLAVIGHSDSITSASEVSESKMKENLDTHVNSLRSQYPNNTIIYLIEGLSAWNRKSQTVKNRAYTAAVRSQTLPEEHPPDTAPPSTQPRRPASTTTNKRKKSKPPSIDLSTITPDSTESLLLHLQLTHQPLLIHHTTSPATTASQISAFTQHLSTRPYRLATQSHNLASASFCMATGQIRTGSTVHETYINMLQEVNRVTPSMAYGISAAGYSSVGKLVKGFREQGNLVLEDVRKSVNKDGGWSDRRLGPMVSKRLWKVFMGRDPGGRDGIA